MLFSSNLHAALPPSAVSTSQAQPNISFSPKPTQSIAPQAAPLSTIRTSLMDRASGVETLADKRTRIIALKFTRFAQIKKRAAELYQLLQNYRANRSDYEREQARLNRRNKSEASAYLVDEQKRLIEYEKYMRNELKTLKGAFAKFATIIENYVAAAQLLQNEAPSQDQLNQAENRLTSPSDTRWIANGVKTASPALTNPQDTSLADAATQIRAGNLDFAINYLNTIIPFHSLPITRKPFVPSPTNNDLINQQVNQAGSQQDMRAGQIDMASPQQSQTSGARDMTAAAPPKIEMRGNKPYVAPTPYSRLYWQDPKSGR